MALQSFRNVDLAVYYSSTHGSNILLMCLFVGLSSASLSRAYDFVTRGTIRLLVELCTSRSSDSDIFSQRIGISLTVTGLDKAALKYHSPNHRMNKKLRYREEHSASVVISWCRPTL